jgi:acyl-CoA synthetase (AMP-forming)/AMP-acid ligase II
MSADCEETTANALIAQAQDDLRLRILNASLAHRETDWTTREFLPDPALSFPAVFERRAARLPEQPALHVVGFTGREPHATPLLFAELMERTQKAARLLSQHGVRSCDRVILSLSDPGAFLAFFLAAQCLGSIPVPLPAVAELPHQAYRNRILSVAGDAHPKTIVFDDATAVDIIGTALSEEMEPIDARQLDRTTQHDSVKLSWRRPLHEIAFLQYTSGSTGQPKGVVVLHYNLIANLRAMIEGLRIGSSDRIYSWLPLFHDMGLIAGLLMGIYAGIPAFVSSPRQFVARPDSWLRGVSRFRATFSPAPNFAFHVVAYRLPDSSLHDLDLTSWRLACDGAEPIDAETARAFVRRLAPFGLRENSFRAVYGLAESTLASTVPEFESATRFDYVDRHELAADGVAAAVEADDANSMTFVCVGKAVPGHAIRIVEPGTGLPLPERRLGEIEIRGPSVTPCYFLQLLSAVAPREALRTGDLGYLADGQLYVVDRLKDMLIVGGRKFAAHDVEQIVAKTPGVRRGAVAAFTLRGKDGSDRLIVALAPDPRARVEHDTLVRDVRLNVFNHVGVTPADICIVRPGDIPRTSSGKLARAACSKAYESGEWQPSSIPVARPDRSHEDPAGCVAPAP